MYDRFRKAYGRVRTWPLVGVATSRLVWALKGALGRPVHLPPAAGPPVKAMRAACALPQADTRLLVALAAVQGLSERVTALEATGARRLERRAEDPALAERPGAVSVVVSTLDRAQWLDRALSALAYQRHRDVEVIVVAGPSTDKTAEVLTRHASRIRTLTCRQANLSASRNLGLELARGEVVAFLDDDATPEPDWLERLCAPYADPRVGGVGGPIRDHTGLRFQCRTMVADRFGRSAEPDDPARPAVDAPGPGVERYLSLTGTNSSFRRRALLEIGGFDEAYTYFLDETDVCLRLAQAGWRLEVASDAEVHHAYAPSAQRRADRAPLSLLAPARSTAYFAFRNAAPVHGAAAAAEHLQAYAQELAHDIAWRCDQGVADAEHGARLQSEVEAGLAEGVAAALRGPRRLLPARRHEPLREPVAGRLGRRPSLQDRLKLCLLSQDYPRDDAPGPPVGGVAVWTQALAQALAARGHEVSVVTRAGMHPPCVGFEAQAGAGLWVHRIGPSAGPLRRRALLAGVPASVAAPALAAADEVVRIAPRRQFDLVMGPLWDLEPAALVGSPWPTAVSLHTACAQMSPFKPEWSDAYRRDHVDRVIAGERRLLAATPWVLANSSAAAHDIGEVLGLPGLAARAKVIPHGLPDVAARVQAGERPDGAVVILFVGRLEPRKGIEVLLAAAPSLLAAAPDVWLSVIGEDVGPPGQPRTADAFLARHAGAPWLSRVRFEGPLPRAELMARYAACDIVVAPSLYESFGLTALEAAIFAKPCVASRAGGLGEIVQDGETGFLTPPGEACALANALAPLVRDACLRRAMGEAGRRRYEARFTADAMARDFEAWVRETIVAPRRFAAE